MASILGWKDVLRPIRDGYRHLFPTPDSGPSPEERSKSREHDRLKGFTYFDTFEQLEAWDVDQSDPLQRANTPLLSRCPTNDTKKEWGTNVLLCHDYAGNYHNYESVQELGVTEEMYACEYLQYINTFVYFSHKLVCVPPPTWTNTLHRNGVKTLGTIILEPQAKNIERLLQYTGDGDGMVFDLAIKLASMARHYSFDGWLVNIEKPFPKESWSPDILQAFLIQLRKELGDDMQLVWYDALTTSNEVYYQNGLNISNLPFAEACGSILTNYCWSASQAKDSKCVATKSGIDTEKVFFGIDVWAQNKSGLTIPRTTYGKGGTTTGVAVAKLAEIELSAGVFAPAWSFEHFPGHGRQVEQTVWEGEALPNDLDCSCGSAAFRHPSIKGFSITAHSKVFPAGSDTFFHTDFTRAFGMHNEREKQKVFRSHPLHAQLGAQSILPLPLPLPDHDRPSGLRYRIEDNAGHSKLVIEAHNGPTTENPTNQYFNRWLPLFRLDMPANGTLQVEFVCRNPTSFVGAVPSLYLKFSSSVEYPDKQPQLLSVNRSEDMYTVQAIVGVPSDVAKGIRLKELGFYIGGFSGEGVVPVLEISSISIMPILQRKASTTLIIDGIHVAYRGEGDNKHVRLRWNYDEGNEARRIGVPYSDITGPISHFILQVDGLRVGRAHALEYILDENFVDTLASKEVEVGITAVGFHGRSLACQTTKLRIGPE